MAWSIDFNQHITDDRNCTYWRYDADNFTCHWRWDLFNRFVVLNFNQGVIFVDHIAFLDRPRNDFAFHDAFT